LTALTAARTRGLDLQINRLLALGIHDRLGQSAASFRDALLPLRAHLPTAPAEADVDAGTADAVLVLHTPGLPARQLLTLLKRNGREAVERLYPKQPEDFRPTEALPLPAGEAYLLLGVDRGNATLNAVPVDAQQQLAAQGRSPLTVEEGIGVLLQWPLFLKPNHCFMLLGSRCGDRRVPALWLSDGRPKLGWCWEGNPHTWLGFASCARRSPGVALTGCSTRPAVQAGSTTTRGQRSA
jgi:hypothetical protein